MSILYHNSWLILDKKVLIHNIKQFKRIIGDKVQLIAVVKSNAYGHGLEQVAKICAQQKEIDKLAIFNLEEALYLKKIGARKPLLILNDYDLRLINKVEQIKNVEFVVYHLVQAQKLNLLAQKLKSKIKIHLKIDTGTSRLGILANQVVSFAKKLLKLKNLKLYGILTHFATAEEKDQCFTKIQIKIFQTVINNLIKAGINIPCQHTACSAAILLQKESHFNAVRLGLSLYGLWSLEDHKKEIKKKYPFLNLKPVLTWQSKIIQIKKLSKNTFIGYGRTYKLNQDAKIAIIPVGYWDGYDRRLSNKARVLIQGKGVKF